jgi:hypothetical protein
MQTDGLIVGNCLRNIRYHEVPLATEDYRAGYLAGITVGDGTFRYVEGATRAEQKVPYWRVALRETDEAALGRIVAYLAAFGIEARVRAFNRGVTSVTPAGGIYPSELHPMKKVEIRSMGSLEAINNILKTRDTLEFKRGFLAGFFDAEGTGQEGRGGHVRVSQKDTSVLHLVARYGASLGFRFSVTERSDSHCSYASLQGGFLQRLRFMSTCQPILTRKAGVVGTSVQYDPSEIIAIEPGPVKDVVDIQTSTGTFFAAGLATHNCFRKKGGCGAKYPDGDQLIESQQVGRVFNPDIADQVNTIQKMSQKRSLVAVTLLAVNASEFFTQDVEDFNFITTTGRVKESATEAPESRAARGAEAADSRRFSPRPEAVVNRDEEGSLDDAVLAACRSLGRTEEQLAEYLQKKYGASGVGLLTAEQKREVLSFLNEKIAKQRAA